jgi:hypothetical protein
MMRDSLARHEIVALLIVILLLSPRVALQCVAANLSPSPHPMG